VGILLAHLPRERKNKNDSRSIFFHLRRFCKPWYHGGMDIKKLFAEHGIVKLHLARALGITHGAVNQWRRVPAERVVAVERITGIPREVLRPDVFAPDGAQ
jgi:hypothetical protein